MKRPGIFERAMIEWRVVAAFTAVLLAIGVHSFFTMPRQEFPTFTIRQGLVVGVMPGATSAEVEDRLARPVEEFLFGYQQVDKEKTYSVSRDGQLVVYVELLPEIDKVKAADFWAKLRHGLNELKAQRLPAEVVALVANDDFGDTSALIFTVTAEGRSPRELESYVERLEKHLRRIDATSKLRRHGLQRETLRVTISRERLAAYGVRPATVLASLQGMGGVPFPARLDGDEYEFPIHVGRTLRSEAELGDTVLLALPGGELLHLKDVADIRREYGHDDAKVRYNGATAAVLSVEMQEGNDITHFGDQVDEALAATRAELPPDVKITRIADQPEVVRASVGSFLKEFGLSILAVILVTLLLLPLRVAAVAAISIPLTVTITLGILEALGIVLETVSLAALVVVLGMVVDNAIVIIDDHVARLDHGADPWTAAWSSARELFVPVFVATLAIVVAYVPIPLLVGGVAGDFLSSLPYTVAAALGTSLLVAAFLVPILNSRLIRRGLARAEGKPSLLDRIQGTFDRAIEAAFRHPWATVGAGVASVALAGGLALLLPSQMFPKVERNQFAVEVFLPNGKSLGQTDELIRELEKELLADPRVVDVTAFVGQSSPRFHAVYAPNFPSRHFGQLLVNTVGQEEALEVLRDFSARYDGQVTDGWIRWKQLDFQPGSPIEIRISGEDIADLKRVAAVVEARAREIPGTTWVRNDYEEALPSIEVTPDVEAAARLGVPPALLGASLALGTKGIEVGTIWEGDYPVRVLLRDDGPDATTVDGLRQQYVSSTLLAASVPLEQIATVKPVWQEGAIVRRNGVRTLTVQVDVASGVVASAVLAELDPFLAGLDLPPGVRIDFGGERSLSEETIVPMAYSLLLSIGCIFLILLVYFRRFRKALVVAAGMPLTLLGAVVGLLLFHYPFGVTAFAGVIGLVGLVVRNGVILVGYIEELRDGGEGVREAALAAAKRRMRPIYLTSMAAAIGVIPMVLGGSTLWGPLGTVTCFGLLFAMVLTLFVLPVLYWLLCRGEERKAGSGAAAVAGVAAAVVAAAGAALIPLPASATEAPAATVEAPEAGDGAGAYTLAQCKALTLERNAGVKRAALEVEAAESTRKAAFTKYFPSVSAAGAAMVANDPLVKLETQGGNLPVYNGDPRTLPTATSFAYMPATTMAFGEKVGVVSLAATQPLFAGGRIVNGNRLAAVGEDAAREKAELARRDALAATEEKYWTILALEEKRATVDAFDAMLAALEKEVNDAAASGLATRNDVLKVELHRKGLDVDRKQLDDGLVLARRDLRRHLGLPEGDGLALADPIPAPEDPAPLARHREDALERRTELRLLSSAVRAEELQKSMAKGAMAPTVSVGAGVFHAEVEGLEAMDNAVAFGLVQVPLTALWEGAHQVAGHERRVQAARSRLEETKELLALEVEKTWSDLQAAWQRSAVADLAVAQAEENLRVETDRRNAGLSAHSDLLDAQAELRKAEDARTEARVDYQRKRAAYLRAVGIE